MKNKKIILGVLAALVVVAVAIFSTNSNLFQGIMRTERTPISSGSSTTSQTCTNTWSTALRGSYSYAEDATTAGAPLSGITSDQIRGLAKKIQNGCDLKIQFERIPQGADRETTMNCDAVDILGNVNDSTGSTYVSCLSTTPLPLGEFHNSNLLYDEVAFVTLGSTPRLHKYRTTILGEDRESASFFGPTGWDINTEWKVTAWVKK